MGGKGRSCLLDCYCGRHQDQRCKIGCICDRHQNRGNLGHNEDCQCGWCTHKGLLGKTKIVSDETRQRLGEILKRRIAAGTGTSGFTGHIHTEETRRKIAMRSIKNWQDPEYAQRVLSASGRALNIHPNRSEQVLAEIIGALGFEFVGDGQLVIDGKCPDFWDGGTGLVELYGDYWHAGQDPQERIDLFKDKGYDCLVIWEHELIDSEAVWEKVQTFACRV